MEYKLNLGGEIELSSVPAIRWLSNDWADYYTWGQELEKAFPNQDSHSFATAILHNGHPFENQVPLSIVSLVMIQQGDNEGPDWQWEVVLDNAETWIATGGCDFTGWDCQSWLSWDQLE